jgi:hypothetical protein
MTIRRWPDGHRDRHRSSTELGTSSREEAEHVLRVLRVALRESLSLLDRQLRFTLGEGYAFDDRLSGWDTRPSTAYELTLEGSLRELVRQSPVAAMPLVPRNQLERKADLALRWMERALLATDPLVQLLYLFFALEALLGDKAEGLKAPVLAYRRAMLGEASGHGFTHPSVTFVLYEEVRSAAVHGGEVPEVTDELVKSFASDVRLALNEYLTYGAVQNFTKQSQLVRTLDSHPEHERMYEWLRVNGGDMWAKYLDSTWLNELRSLLNTTITRVRQVTSADGPWETPLADSQAGRELAAEEARRPDPLTGSWPWQLAPTIARMALRVALEEAKGFSTAFIPNVTSYSADVLCRAVLETSSLAWWLLDPAVDAKTRMARSLAYRLHSAEQTRKAIDALNLEPDDNPSEYGELPQDVMEDIANVGLPNDQRGRPLFSKDEARLSYTNRVANLVVQIWPQRDLPYAVLSAVAHGEMLGLQRNLADGPDGKPSLRVGPSAGSDGWLWLDTYLVIGALVFTAERGAAFLGLGDELAAISAWMEDVQGRLGALRPSGSGEQHEEAVQTSDDGPTQPAG